MEDAFPRETPKSHHSEYLVPTRYCAYLGILGLIKKTQLPSKVKTSRCDPAAATPLHSQIQRLLLTVSVTADTGLSVASCYVYPQIHISTYTREHLLNNMRDC